MTRAELAAQIKAKHPSYASVPDEELVDRIVAKYPQYGDKLDKEAPKPSALSRFGSALADAIPEPIRNPSMLGEVPGAVADLARENPMALVNPMSMIGNDIANQSVQSFQDQRAKGTNLASSLAAGIPVVGPAAAQVGEEIGQGNYASAAGHAIPLLAPFAAEGLSGAAGRVVEPVGTATRTGASVAKNAALGAVKTGATDAFNALLEGKGFSGGVAHALKGATKGGYEAARATFEARKALAKVAEDHPILAEKIAPIMEEAAKVPETPKPAVVKPAAPKKLTVAQQSKALKGLGWSPENIAKLSPAERLRVVEAGEAWPPGKGSLSSGVGTPATGLSNKGYSSKSPNERFAVNNTPNARVPVDDADMANLLQKSIDGPPPKSIKKVPPSPGEAIKADILQFHKAGDSRVRIASKIAQKYGLPESQLNFEIAQFLAGRR